MCQKLFPNLYFCKYQTVNCNHINQKHILTYFERGIKYKRVFSSVEFDVNGTKLNLLIFVPLQTNAESKGATYIDFIKITIIQLL